MEAGLGISKFKFLIKKSYFQLNFFLQFWVIKTLDPEWIRIPFKWQLYYQLVVSWPYCWDRAWGGWRLQARSGSPGSGHWTTHLTNKTALENPPKKLQKSEKKKIHLCLFFILSSSVVDRRIWIHYFELRIRILVWFRIRLLTIYQRLKKF